MRLSRPGNVRGRLLTLAVTLCALAFIPTDVRAQQGGTVSGTVTDQGTQRPVSDVQILVAGSQRGAISDAQGRFAIPGIPAGTREIRSRRVGYAPRSITVVVVSGQTTTATFVLTQAASELQEVVVNAVTGLSERRAEVGVNTGYIDVGSLNKGPITKMADVLQGRVAGVNLAAVNYHFQSKDSLIDAIVARRFEPMNAKRFAMLDALEAAHPTGRLPLEGVLEAFLAPVVELKAQGDHIRAFMGRCFTLPEEFMQRVFLRHLKPVMERFNGAFARAVPELSDADRVWRTMFSIGAMVHVMSWSTVLPQISGGLLDPSDTKELTRRIVTFAAAGFRAEGGIG